MSDQLEMSELRAPAWVINKNESVVGAMQRWAQEKAQHQRSLREQLAKGEITGDVYDTEMAKGIPTGTADVGNYTIRDLAPVAVNTQWTTSSPFELVLQKLLPDENATLIRHEWTRELTYYQDGFDGSVGEFQRGVTVRGTTDQNSVYLKMMATEAATSYIASRQTSYIDSMGVNDVSERERRRAQLALMYLQNMNMYRSRDDTHRLGAINGTYVKGIEQQIEEGTVSSPFAADLGGSHVIDFLGGAPTFNNTRAVQIASIMLFQGVTVGIMDPAVRAGFSASLDGAVRLMGAEFEALTWGKTAHGVNVGMAGSGTNLHFITDNALSPIYYQRKYTTSRPDTAPTTLPTVQGDSAAQNDGTSFNGVVDTVTSKFDAGTEGAGEVFYVITYKVNGVESLGTRWPASGTDTVAVNQEYAFRVAAPTNADTICVYRGQTDSANTNMTDAWHIFDVAADASGETIFFDNNLDRPNTSRAFFLPIDGPMMNAIYNAGSSDVALRQLQASRGGTLGSDRGSYGNNGVRCVRLGGRMGMIQMGRTHYSDSDPAAYLSIYSPLVPDAPKAFEFKNIRSSQTPAGALPS